MRRRSTSSSGLPGSSSIPRLCQSSPDWIARSWIGRLIAPTSCRPCFINPYHETCPRRRSNRAPLWPRMMFVSTILLALVVGALAGGGIPRLADLRLRWSLLLLGALLLRILAGLSRGSGADIPVGWAFIGAYGLVFIWLWGNWRVPGLQIAAVGIAANMIAVLINEGQMPIWAAAFSAAGFTHADIANDPFHFLLET